MVALWKNRYDVITLPPVLPFGCNLVSIWHAKLSQIEQKTANIIVNKLSSLQCLLRTTNMTKDDITSQHSDIKAMCCTSQIVAFDWGYLSSTLSVSVISENMIIKGDTIGRERY